MNAKVNKLKEALRTGKTVFGTWAQIGSPEVVETIGYQGYDFVIIDMEHGQITIETAGAMVRAAEATHISPIIRVPYNEASMIMHALDSGADGVLVPGICSKEAAEAAVKAAKYAPLGSRGACPWVRAAQYYSRDWAVHVKHSNEDTMVWLLVEGKEGVDNFDEILKVPHIDGIVTGPVDLAETLGISGQLEHPMLQKALENMANKAKEQNIHLIAAMIGEITPEEISRSTQKWSRLGCKIMTVCGDHGILCTHFNWALQSAKDALLKNNDEG